MKYTISLVYLTTFLFLFGESIQPAPRVEIYESIVCRHYYANALHGDESCKVPPVQEELVLLGGLERLSIIIPSILAIPFAALADRVGHSFVLSLAVFGVFLEELWAFVVCWFPDVFPIRLIWLHFVFSLLGGGITVVITLLHVIVAAVVPSEMRTAVFFRVRAAGVGASVLGYAAAALSMKANVWLPWTIGLLSLVLALFTAIILPKTTSQENMDSAEAEQHKGWKEHVKSSLTLLRRICHLLVGNKQICVMLLLVLLCQLGFDSLPLMMIIYVSKRYHWSFSNANLLNSLEMTFEFIVLVFLLPPLTNLLSRRRHSAFAKDKYIAQGSIILLAIGAIFLGFASVIPVAIIGIILMAFGAGQDSVLRSIATDMVNTSEVSIVYSAITMLRAVGGSISGPIYAGLYASGLHMGETWLGLPFLVAGGLFGVAWLLLMLLRETSGYELVPDESQEDDIVQT